MELRQLTKCPDCHVEPGYTHKPGCDVERCSYCGGQVLQCGGCPDAEGNMRHDVAFARWTGLWPGTAECVLLGLFVKWTDKGWEMCDQHDPAARPDLNKFHEMGYDQIFFVKPTKENGKEI